MPRHNALRDSWIDWLVRGCSLPLDHVCIVLAVAQAVVDEFVRRTKHGRPRAVPTRPPRPGRAAGDPVTRILAQAGHKVQALEALGYPPARIAVILDLDGAIVRDFLKRTSPVRRSTLSRPREPAAQARLDANRRRRQHRLAARRRRQAARIGPVVPASWRSTWSRRPVPRDAELDLVVAPIAAAPPELPELAAVTTEDPDPVPARHEWTGPASMKAIGEAHGSARLTEADVIAIRRGFAAGRSIYSLAKERAIATGTARAIVRFETWRHVQDPACPAPV